MVVISVVIIYPVNNNNHLAIISFNNIYIYIYIYLYIYI